MSRHLLIGDGTALTWAGGLVADGAISVQKMSSDGPTELVLGDTAANAPQIRIVMGDANGKDTVSPWIYGRDVINWSGKSYAAPAACTVTDTITGISAAVGTLVLKFVRVGGPRPEFFSFSTTIGTAGDPTIAAAATDILIEAAFEALTDIPDWLNPLATTTGSATVFSGAIRGDIAQSGNTWDYAPAQIQLIVESYDGGTQTHVASATTGGDPGYGDGFVVKAMENEAMGVTYGYYNRLAQPVTPLNNAATGTNYDMYSLVATKDGSSSSQINGVDNLIEINLALVAGDDDSIVVESKLNAYLAGSFANVTL